MTLFGDIYRGRRVLVTGHTGFKGSWLTLWLQTLGAHVSGLALAPDTQPSHWAALALTEVDDHRADLRDASTVRDVLETCRPEIIFHLAAQPLVRRSYRDPAVTFSTNITGLVNLLDAVRACDSVRVMVNVTTDKVYAESATVDGYHETGRLGGHDPYSTSKACSELVTDCYRKSFFEPVREHRQLVRLATARAGNVIGGGDWGEDRLVPDLARAATSGQPLQVRNPDAVRPWQHVLEPLSGYLCLAQRLWGDGDFAGAWNFGPGPGGEISVTDLVGRLAAHWPALRIHHNRGEQPHEAAVLRLNCNKASAKLGWHPVWDIDTALERTAHWYRAFHESGRVSSRDDLTAYVAAAQSRQLAWAA